MAKGFNLKKERSVLTFNKLTPGEGKVKSKVNASN